MPHPTLLGCRQQASRVEPRALRYPAGDRERTEKWGYDKLMAALQGQLGGAEIEKLAAEGAAWSEDQALEEAIKM
jgi:hypothetical protein